MRILAIAPLALAVLPLAAGEFRAGVGAFVAAPQGADFTLGYAPGEGRWSFGWRYVQWVDRKNDPFTGRALSDVRESRTGPLVSLSFRPRSRGSFYLAAAIYRYAKRETSRVFGDSGSDSTTAPAAGGGYRHALGAWGFYDVGILLSPGIHLRTQTSTGAEDDSGGFDGMAQIGVRLRGGR